MEKITLILDGKEENFFGESKSECILKMYDRTIQLQKQHKEKEAKENYTESSAQNAKGFLLYNPFDKKYFFRIYDEQDKTKFTDYSLNAEDMEITINDRYVSLYQGNTKNKVDWSSKTLGK